MQDGKTIIATYKSLSQICHELLFEDKFKDVLAGDKSRLREAFFQNLYKVLQTAFDITVSEKKLEKFIRTHGANPEDDALADFLGASLENFETYALINNYYLRFIISFSKYAKDEDKKEIEQLIVDKGLDSKGLAGIESTYKNILQTLKSVPAA